MSEDIIATRELTREPFGVNLFAVTPTEAPTSVLDAYAESVRSSTSYTGVEPGSPRSDDDHFEEKCDVLLADPVAVVSFTFGCPSPALVDRLHGAGSRVWVTVTGIDEARAAAGAGADGLVAQGIEAGGHRASFDDSDRGDYGLLALLQLLSAAVDLPLIATGGIANGRGVAAVLCAGAAAAQVGSAFMLCPEAGTAEVHRDALARPGDTAVTRAFTGRNARGIVNRFLTEHTDEAPAAYPAVHYMTAPIRAEARKTGDSELLNLWAGQAHELAEELPAGDLVRKLDADARAAIVRTSRAIE